MFQFQGVWLPDGEKHFPLWMEKNGEIIDGRGSYQIRKWRACLPWIKDWRVAVDVGAHVGLWAMQLVKRFKDVHAFEPVEAFRECFDKNLFGMVNGANVQVYPCALGGAPGEAMMKIPSLDGGIDSGGTHIGEFDGDLTCDRSKQGWVEVKRLDEFCFRYVDYLKIDCEGYEHHVIEGARETLLRCKPCVIVEQKPHKLGPNFGITGTPAVDMLIAMGAKQRAVLSGDHILSWD